MSKFDLAPLNKAFAHHASHGRGEAVEGHAVKGNIARDGAPKRAHVVPLHGGMNRQTDCGAVAFGGDHATALDSLTSSTVPAGRVTAPGWGNAGVQSGNPLAKPPAPKDKLTRVQPSYGMRSRTDSKTALHEIGEAILREAFSVADAQTRQAHNRGCDGAKLPDSVNEN